jgi:hypothetical protein
MADATRHTRPDIRVPRPQHLPRLLEPWVREEQRPRYVILHTASPSLPLACLREGSATGDSLPWLHSEC